MKASLPKIVSFIAVATLSAYGQNISNYEFTVSSQSPTAYFKLDGSLTNTVNGSVVLEPFAGGYASDVYRTTSNCWYFVDQNTAFLRNLTDPLISGGRM